MSINNYQTKMKPYKYTKNNLKLGAILLAIIAVIYLIKKLYIFLEQLI